MGLNICATADITNKQSQKHKAIVLNLHQQSQEEDSHAFAVQNNWHSFKYILRIQIDINVRPARAEGLALQFQQD